MMALISIFNIKIYTIKYSYIYILVFKCLYLN